MTYEPPEYPAGIQPPNLPPRSVPQPEYPAGIQPPSTKSTSDNTINSLYANAGQHTGQQQNIPYDVPAIPPQRQLQTYPADDDPKDPSHYIRDPHKLIGYLIPFPRPRLNPTVDPAIIPTRFMIYTPPPPPLHNPAEGEKEAKLHKVQRKWEQEVRSAKTSTAKTASWKGVKSKATKGINWAMNQTTNSNLDFLSRVSPTNSDRESGSSDTEGSTTKKTVPVEEMILVYPTTLHLNNEQMRSEFVNTMLRTKSKAQRDTVIATGLMPVAYGIDILATLVWPFGGLGEIDTLWAWSSFRGAKTARSVTKRLSSASKSQDPHTNQEDDNQLQLNFIQSERMTILAQYLEAACHKVDDAIFPGYHTSPTETQVLEAIGWSPHKTAGGEINEQNWEDEQWETSEVKEDIKLTFRKAAKEWKRWCVRLEKDPEKALAK